MDKEKDPDQISEEDLGLDHKEDPGLVVKGQVPMLKNSFQNNTELPWWCEKDFSRSYKSRIIQKPENYDDFLYLLKNKNLKIMSMDEMRDELIIAVMIHTQGNRTKAAKILKKSIRWLRTHLSRLYDLGIFVG